jgi:hypothetical protein
VGQRGYVSLLRLAGLVAERRFVDHDEIATRIVGAVGQAGARELLDLLTRPRTVQGVKVAAP